MLDPHKNCILFYLKNKFFLVLLEHNVSFDVPVTTFMCLFQSDKYTGRNNLARELKLQDIDGNSNQPLLAEVIKRLSPSTSGEVFVL